MKKYKVFLFVFLFSVFLFSIYKYVYKDHRDITSEEASYIVSISDLEIAFQENETVATTKYLDKTIIVSGNITSVDTSANSIMLNEKMNVVFSGKPNKVLKKDVLIKVKGRFIGYDELLDEYKIDQSTLIK
jgi:hypothetical protein